jgi:hypothetical protein
MLQTHKFGIEQPKSVGEAFEIHLRTNTMYWKDAISLEVKNVDVAFSDLDESEWLPEKTTIHEGI